MLAACGMAVNPVPGPIRGHIVHSAERANGQSEKRRIEKSRFPARRLFEFLFYFELCLRIVWARGFSFANLAPAYKFAKSEPGVADFIDVEANNHHSATANTIKKPQIRHRFDFMVEENAATSIRRKRASQKKVMLTLKQAENRTESYSSNLHL